MPKLSFRILPHSQPQGELLLLHQGPRYARGRDNCIHFNNGKSLKNEITRTSQALQDLPNMKSEALTEHTATSQPLQSKQQHLILILHLPYLNCFKLRGVISILTIAARQALQRELTAFVNAGQADEQSNSSTT